MERKRELDITKGHEGAARRANRAAKSRDAAFTAQTAPRPPFTVQLP